ncbi:hypothetical protein L226DRAFT_267493 [Lentinus tigrinus ALCF2SS1-7]|uniref:uncharacterized protein n=1 Tax=Lentinus tigrinus ALCF2SS1-7 TaxID=1328758 RepID=UPI0011660AF2|nr:hypothetical protein L226DRAFT_267493 [Lentinus tigrinus ALCF2SS1-7]
MKLLKPGPSQCKSVLRPLVTGMIKFNPRIDLRYQRPSRRDVAQSLGVLCICSRTRATSVPQHRCLALTAATVDSRPLNVNGRGHAPWKRRPRTPVYSTQIRSLGCREWPSRRYVASSSLPTGEVWLGSYSHPRNSRIINQGLKLTRSIEKHGPGYDSGCNASSPHLQTRAQNFSTGAGPP